MQKPHLIFACAAVAVLFGAATGPIALAGPTTEPSSSGPAILVPATQPAGLVATTQPILGPGVTLSGKTGTDRVATTEPAAGVPTTQPVAAAPATQPADLRAAADERHKHLDPRWRQNNDAMRAAQRSRWADALIVQTFKPGALVSLSISNGNLKVDSTDLLTAQPVRVAVEGSKAVYMLARPRAAMMGGAFAAAANGPYLSLTRYDFDAKEEEPWQTRLFINNRTMTITAQNLYGSTNFMQANGMITLQVIEYAQLGQPSKVVFTTQAPTLLQLRAEHPEEFRMYVIPVLSRFSDPAFLQPGPTDVYSAFVEIPADQKIVQELGQIVPQLDADDPADREIAIGKLQSLGVPGVLAVLRMDDSPLSDEQRLRLNAFVAGYRRLPITDPAVQRRNLNFLIDCLEYDDPSVRAVAKADLARQTHQPIEFDTGLTGAAIEKAVDTLRKQLLAPPAQPAQAAPSTQPSPQV